ncbi:30S ribosomal protein S4 [Candidatus Pacearchaeota archaeon CG06_land_8_20_14_3_00_35_12]|nr:MAG: 30S ribosomal protein S4 [Candidatus Pacearchaeota archaeon CG06_land_8_20_14_3_00_35_12]
MRRQHKKYRKPKNSFDKERIEEEKKIVQKYGLKNKREIWKADAFIDKIRKTAKKLLTAEAEKQEAFLEKIIKLGLTGKNSKIDDILSLKKEDILERRLQTIVFKKGLAKTPNHARQLITHKHVAVENSLVNIPSFIVPIYLEDKIRLK